jgi:tetratricopeptide (TPR) repeat protein
LHVHDLSQAKTCHEQALHILREIGERVEEGWALVGLGILYGLEGDYAQALRCCEQALVIFGETGAQHGQEQTLPELVEINAWLGDYARARACCEQGLEIRHKTPTMQNYLILLQGQISHYLGDHRAARECAQKALQFALKRDRPGTEAEALILLGHALSGLDQIADAAAAYRQSAALYRTLDRIEYGAASPLAELARLAAAQGDQPQALAYADEVLSILETHPELEGFSEPLRVYLNCYQVFLANEDPRADEILDAAYRLIQERASKIDDEALRRSYLENVAENREIIAAWLARSRR